MMKAFPRLLLISSFSLALAGCATMRSSDKYKVGVESSIYAGSHAPTEKAAVAFTVYFGTHVVRTGTDGRGCCYSTGVGIVNAGKPRGGRGDALDRGRI